MNFFTQHKGRMILGIPFIFVIALALFTTFFGARKNVVGLLPGDSSVRLNTEFSVQVVIETKELINVVGGTVRFPQDRLEAVETSIMESALDIWMQEPVISNENGLIAFAGGSTLGGLEGTHEVFRITFKPRRSGSAVIRLEDINLLAHDGSGENVSEETRDGVYIVRRAITNLGGGGSDDSPKEEEISADLSDVSVFIFYLNQKKYLEGLDLNEDGTLDLSDLEELVADVLIDEEGVACDEADGECVKTTQEPDTIKEE